MGISNEDCIKWKEDPSRNPATGRKISATGKIYKDLKEKCNNESKPTVTKKVLKVGPEHCPAWKKDPTRNPLTNRKLNMKAKNGVYAQLVKICGFTTRAGPSSKSLNIHRLRLINAVKKHIQPIIHRVDTLEARVKFADIVRNYLKDLNPCFTKKDGKIFLETKSHKEVVIFDKRIGTPSAYGIAYFNKGTSFARLLKFSCKIMAELPQHGIEVSLLKKMSSLAETGKSPNMPITYKVLNCKKSVDRDTLPPVLKGGDRYYVVINELADEDLRMWFTRKHNDDEYESIMMQILLGVYAFHQLGYVHNDCHFGNFLIHKVKPGGYWHYKVAGFNIYVPNTGSLLVMWDPGLAEKYDKSDAIKDYSRPFILARIVDSAYGNKYPGPSPKPLSINVLDNFVVPFIQLLSNPYRQLVFISEDKYIPSIFKMIEENDTISTKHVIISSKQGILPPRGVLNKTPYTCV